MGERANVLIAGLSGLGRGVRGKHSSMDDFVILGQADGQGGTWRDNHYPDCAFDGQPSLGSSCFAPGADRVSRRAGRGSILPHIRHNANVMKASCDESTSKWVVCMADRAMLGTAMTSVTLAG